MARRRGGRSGRPDPATEAFRNGLERVSAHGLFGRLLGACSVVRDERSRCPEDGWAVVLEGGVIHVHPTRRATPEEWVWVLAHGLLHLALEHFQQRPRSHEWNAAACCAARRFLEGLKLGRVPEDLLCPEAMPPGSEGQLYEAFLERGVPPALGCLGLAGPGAADLAFTPARERAPRLPHGLRVGWQQTPPRWSQLFAEALEGAVCQALGAVGGDDGDTAAKRARNWLVTHFPLLGALASSVEIVERPDVLARLQIGIAAVSTELREVYIDSRRLDDEECRFVLAHELLHVGLRHDVRGCGRDPFLWNVACDYVINGWLVEMRIGQLPKVGVLYDRTLAGLSAEAIYERIARDLRRLRKLSTLRGPGLCDVIDERGEGWWRTADGLSLDELYRGLLRQGIAWHEALEHTAGRGFLPAGLIEEVRALAQPPIPWDVELAQWFDAWFAPLEWRRTFARASRRQQSTPDLPRPAWVVREEQLDGRTFGVVLDTSGSMDRALLARALGAISSYATSRDVPRVRVVYSDAAPYDAGYLGAEELAGRVRVRGRGGTLLQPAIDLLQGARDFPADGPILVITDTRFSEPLRLRREHAFLIPEGFWLPFRPVGPVFRLR